MTRPPLRAVALFSGMLDSILAVRLVQEQGIVVRGLHFLSVFMHDSQWVLEAAARLGIQVESVTVGEDYYRRARYPHFGWGRGANPCIDCRIGWFRAAAERIERGEADFAISGEVLGQKAFGQKRRDLDRIAWHAGLEHRLVRPLSARRLPISEPERQGWLDRERLGSYAGARRAELLAWAARIGWQDAPSAGNCCRLSDRGFSYKVRDLWEHLGQPTRWDYQLLAAGRHYRLSPSVKVVVAHNQLECQWLDQMQSDRQARPSLLIEPSDFIGPSALLIGPPLPRFQRELAGLIWSLSRQPPAVGTLRYRPSGGNWTQRGMARPPEADRDWTTLCAP